MNKYTTLNSLLLDDYSVKVFYSNDENLKEFGELLSNQTSRSIIRALIEKEYYKNELAEKLDMRLSLVDHHLKKLEALNMITVSEKQIAKKGVRHRFFKINSEIFISNSSKNSRHDEQTPQRIFKNGVKFTSIAIASGLAYFISKYSFDLKEIWTSTQDTSTLYILNESSIIIALSVTVVGLSLERIWTAMKNKKKGLKSPRET